MRIRSSLATLILGTLGSLWCTGAMAQTAAPHSRLASGPAAASAPVVAQATSPTPCTGIEDVLLIQDDPGWGPVPGEPLGADVAELRAQGKAFCSIRSENLASAQLGRFRLILIPSVQAAPYYENLFPDGTVSPVLAEWVRGGGILSANLADIGDWVGYTFIGGLRHVFTTSEDNDIVAPGHPIVTGAAPCPSGHCAPIRDAGPGDDLDNWNGSSHGYFINLPARTTVILSQPDVTGDGNPEPVLIEYPFGAGRVIAALTTTEWRWGHYPLFPLNRKLLANDIAYQSSLVRPTSKDQCKNGGWRDFPGFKNQGDCVSFVATGGKNSPTGP